jgi:hypothetical protein
MLASAMIDVPNVRHQKKTMTDIKNHDTSPSPLALMVVGLRNRACATRDLASALPLKD